MNIIKRDGHLVLYDITKISNAITKANESVNIECRMSNDVITTITNNINTIITDRFIHDNHTSTVEEIQDIVEKELMKAAYYEVAKAYITYRYKKSICRNIDGQVMKTMHELTFSSSADSEMKRENGNINGDSSMGLMLKYGSENAKAFTLAEVESERFAKAHIDGWIHQHDLDFYSTGTLTCCQIDIKELFEYGFFTGHGAIRPPKSIRSYASLACVVIQANQNEMHFGM